MLRTGRALALTTLFALLLTCGIRGDEKSDKDKKPDPALDLQTLKNATASNTQTLKEIKEELSKVNKAVIDRLDAQDKTLANQDLDLKRMQKDLAETREQLKNLQDAIGTMKSNQPRVARSIDPAPLTPATGQIRLVNQLANPITITIENTAYLLRGGEMRMLNNRPAGALNYQVSAPFDYTGVYSRSTQLDPNQQLSILVGP
jgi:hypothetical protein